MGRDSVTDCGLTESGHSFGGFCGLGKVWPAIIPSLLPMLTKEQDENIRYYVREALTAVGWRPGRM